MPPTRRARRRTLAIIPTLFVALVAAACGSDDESSPEASTPAAEAGDTTAAESGAATTAGGAASGPGEFAKANYTTDLSADCPSPLIIQKDWLAEVEHAALYQMIGAGGTLSANVYTGPLGSTGIDLTIIDGGPGLGDGVLPFTSLYAGNLVQNLTPHLAYVGTDDAIQYSKEFPSIAVVTPLDKSPGMLMYDPSVYPSVKTIQELIDTGADIYVTTKAYSYVQYLISQGVPEDRFIEGYAGDKEKFIAAGGKLINQGYASNEVYSYENETDAWNKPVDYVLVNDLGFQPYPSALSVATNKLEELRPCLEKLVPIIQQAQVDYMKDPSEINTFLADEYNPTYSAPFWFTSKGLNDAATTIMAEDGIVADGPSGLGSFDEARVQSLIDLLVPAFESQGLDSYNPDVATADIMTNEFIDPSIRLGS